jgi:hypothetical protein
MWTSINFVQMVDEITLRQDITENKVSGRFRIRVMSFHFNLGLTL